MASTIFPKRFRSSSNLISLPPARASPDYSEPLANLAAKILYRSPLPSQNDLPIYILNAWSFPDTKAINYDHLLPYVLDRLPNDDELIGGLGYEVVFFADWNGGGNEATQPKKTKPKVAWFLSAYQKLTRATRKRLQKLYIVHGKRWVRVVMGAFTQLVSPKFNKKTVHVSSMSGLALHLPIQDLLIPPSAYLSDRRRTSSIFAPHASGRRAFGIKHPLPTSDSGELMLPRVLREATNFLVMDENVKTEGIFRVCARAQLVDILKEAYDRGQNFIVWRDRNAVVASSHWKEGLGGVEVDNPEQKDGYDVHTAAALIKLWYKELREPIFPPDTYQELKKYDGVPDLDPSQLLAMLSMDDQWSPINSKSRSILTMHLLPLLSRIQEFSDQNQMNAENLSVCFGVSLLCGPNPLEDVKMSQIVRQLLVAMIKHWKTDLAPALGTSFETYAESLQMPEDIDDREDPLEEEETKDVSELEAQTSGITLVDNDESDEELDSPPPALPPRSFAPFTRGRLATPKTSPTKGSPSISTGNTPPRSDNSSPVENHTTTTTTTITSDATGTVKRKPAPSLPVLPRYSTLLDESLDERLSALQNDQYYDTVVPATGGDGDGDESAVSEANGLSVYGEGSSSGVNTRRTSTEPSSSTEPSIQRKPVPKAGPGF